MTDDEELKELLLKVAQKMVEQDISGVKAKLNDTEWQMVVKILPPLSGGGDADESNY